MTKETASSDKSKNTLILYQQVHSWFYKHLVNQILRMRHKSHSLVVVIWYTVGLKNEHLLFHIHLELGDQNLKVRKIHCFIVFYGDAQCLIIKIAGACYVEFNGNQIFFFFCEEDSPLNHIQTG